MSEDSYNKVEASIWIGEEKEYPAFDKRMFVDGATAERIEKTLRDYPDVGHLYFAHGFEKSTVLNFVNKMKVTLEVPTVNSVPPKLHGRVEVVLRVPSWVNKTKRVDGSEISVTDFREVYKTEWNGKCYPEDRVIE